MLDDYLNRLAAERSAQRRAALASVRRPEDLAAWQAGARERLHSVLRGFPRRTPLRAETVGSVERDGYRIEKLVFQSRPRFYVTANVYVPGAAPWPAVVFACGHAPASKAATSYQLLASGLARRGYLVLMLDPLGQGERLHYLEPAPGITAVSHHHTYAAHQALLVGESLARARIWDKVRAIDYLCERGDVRTDRIGCFGHSGGGAMAVLMAAAEPRIAAIAAAGAGGPCEWATLPPASRYSKHVEDGVTDALSLFLPKPVRLICGDNDGARLDWLPQTAEQTAALYEAAGVGDRFSFCFTPGGHEVNRAQRSLVCEWFDRWLQPPGAVAGPGGEGEPLSVEALWCTPTGLVATSLGGIDFPQLVARSARRLARRRAARRGAAGDVRRRLGEALGYVPPAGGPPPAERTIESRALERPAGTSIRLERLVYVSEPGIEVPALLYSAARSEGTGPLVVWIDEDGKDAVPVEAARRLVGAGCAVLALDCRGMGEARDPDLRGNAGRVRESEQDARRYFGPIGTDAANGVRAMTLGRALVGMRAVDALRALDVASRRPDLAARPAVMLGRGAGALVAVVAALDDRVAATAAWRLPASLTAVATHRYYQVGAGSYADALLAHADVDDALTALAPRPVLLVNPLDHDERPLTPSQAARALAGPLAAHPRLTVHAGVTDGQAETALIAWLEAAVSAGTAASTPPPP